MASELSTQERILDAAATLTLDQLRAIVEFAEQLAAETRAEQSRSLQAGSAHEQM